MLRPKSKQELIQALSKADVLELDIEIIDRKESASAKKTKGNAFVKRLQSSISDERDLILACIKLR